MYTNPSSTGRNSEISSPYPLGVTWIDRKCSFSETCMSLGVNLISGVKEILRCCTSKNCIVVWSSNVHKGS